MRGGPWEPPRGRQTDRQTATRRGYSAKTAEQQGPRLLGNVGVSTAIQAAQAKRSDRTEITADRVLKEIARLAFFDARRLLDDDGEPLPIHQLDDDTAAGIAGLETATERRRDEDAGVTAIRKYKIADKNSVWLRWKPPSPSCSAWCGSSGSRSRPHVPGWALRRMTIA